MVLRDEMRHAKHQDVPPLAAGPDEPAATITDGVAFRRSPVVFPIASVG